MYLHNTYILTLNTYSCMHTLKPTAHAHDTHTYTYTHTPVPREKPWR